MKSIKIKYLLLAAAVTTAVVAASNASAAIIISEVDSAGSSTGTSSYNADWFELTNNGSAAVNITGWKMDDNSNSFASAVALRGVTNIAAGQSVIFLEGAATNVNDATIDAAFKTAWFGSNVPTGLTIGNYGGSGVGLSTTADAVNIFDSSGNTITRVDFNALTLGKTFDNAVGLSSTVGSPGTAISQLSAVGVNGAFLSANGAEIGSPGVIAAVPEPESYAMMLAGMGMFGLMFRRNKKSAK